VAFHSRYPNVVPGDTNSAFDVFVRDRQKQTTERVSLASDGTQGNGSRYNPAIEGDGRFVVFTSEASNLVPGDTNGASDVFVHDREAHTTERVSVTQSGAASC
jgi:Tol biopolymer transport system component